MRVPTLTLPLLLTTALVALPSVAGCDSPGGGFQNGDVTSYGVDAGGTSQDSGENLFSQLLGTGGQDTEPPCVGADCPPPPDPGPEPVCETPLPPSVAVATQCQTLCQKLVACTGSTATTQGPCAAECSKAMSAVAPDVISAAMGCYMAASCEDIKAAMDDNGTTSTDPAAAPAPGYPTDMDASGAYPGEDASGAPNFPREDPMPEPSRAEDTALQQCLDSSMGGLMQAPLTGADKTFCDTVGTREQDCSGATQPVPDPRRGGGAADASGGMGDWYCALMAHLLNDAARDMMGACYARPCDEIDACIQGLQACLHIPLGSSSADATGSGSASSGGTEPVPAR